jgi:YesN/AraC family two-component response regulator
VKCEELTEPYKYPFEILKDIQTAIQQKDHEQLLELWERIEKEIVIEKRTPLLIIQHICISVLNALMMDSFSDQLNEDSQKISDMVSKIYAQSSAKELSRLMCEHLTNWIQQMKEELTGKKSHRLIRGVKEYVHDYYDQEISLAEIASNLYVNRNYLSQLFKKVTGETFVTYLNRFRVEKAKQILREKQLMMYEVSEMVGYQNPTYFSQVFKSITGVSPSDYGNEPAKVI